jgi:hypothetical protein
MGLFGVSVLLFIFPTSAKIHLSVFFSKYINFAPEF